MESLNIIWTKQAKKALNEIYQWYKDRSEQAAKKIVKELLSSPRTIKFSKQYQIDEINPNYRRIVVRDYKVLYKESDTIIKVMDIVCTRQAPELLKNK